MVTISWSLKNFITVNLMVLAMGAVLALGAQTVRAARKQGDGNG